MELGRSSAYLGSTTLPLLVLTAVVLVLVKFCLTVYGLFRRRWHLQKLTAHIPDGGLETSFLWGNLHCWPSQNTKEYLDKTLEIWHRLGNLGRDWVGPFICLIQVADPEYIKCALANADSKDNVIYNNLRPWIGDGLIKAGGATWIRHRRMLTPAFHFETLRPYVKVYVESAKVYLQKLSESQGKSYDVFQAANSLTFDIILKCCFSYESNCQTDVENEYANNLHKLTDIIYNKYRYLPFHFAPIFHLSPSGFRFRRHLSYMHGMANETIKRRRKELKEMGEEEEKRSRKYKDFLDILLSVKDENGDGLTDQEIRDEVCTFMFAGHDTSSAAISWCLYNLARFPEHQQKCCDEVKQLLKDRGNTEIQWDDLKSLPFMTMFIKESLRIHSPVPVILRTMAKDVTFPDGTVLPKGTDVTVSPFALHHNSSYWKDPEIFDPYRFLPERSRDRHSHAFIPFSAGPRNCIGQNFAMDEIKVVIAMTITRFRIEADPDKPPEWIPRIVLKSKNGIHLKFHPR